MGKGGRVIAVLAAMVVLAGCGAGDDSDGGSGGGEVDKALAAKGKEIYEGTCASCHSIDGSRRAGPSWKGLAGSQVKLEGGKTVTADDAYLIESIRDPEAKTVDGFTSEVMSYAVPRGSVSKADAEALVAYIKTLK